MVRLALSTLFLATTAIAPAAPPDLKGKTLAEKFAELLPGMGAADNNTRSAAQQGWQDICFQVGAPGNEKFRAEACALMAAKVGTQTPNLARIWLLAQLQRIGRDESVDAVAAILDDKDDEVREAAVRCLANNPSSKATAKLTFPLSSTTGKRKVGLLNALGHRADPTAVNAIAKELLGTDATAAIAAARALGRIPGQESTKALATARPSAKGHVRHAIADATLTHADRLLKDGKVADAAAIYKEFNNPDEPRPVRLAALRGAIQTAGDQASAMILDILVGTEAEAVAIAIGQIDGLSVDALKLITTNLEKLSVPNQVLVITAIAARGDRSQLPIALSAARNSNPNVKRAGVQAIGRLGDASAVEFLLDLAYSKDPVNSAAAESLTRLPTEGINEKLVAVLEAEKSPARATAIVGILERRKAVAAVPALLKAAGGADPGVRTAAFSGLRNLAGPEHVPGMAAALFKTEKGKEREAAELAIVAVCGQIPETEKRTEAVVAALKSGLESHKTDLLPLLGRLGGPQALRLVREALSSDDRALRAAGLVGIYNWPDTSANDDLLALAKTGREANDSLQALQTLIRVNTVPGERTPEERLAAFGAMKKAMALATRDEERRAILQGLGNIRRIETLRYILPYLDQAMLAQAACKGVVELAHSKMLRDPNKAEFDKALDRVIGLCEDKGLIDRAKQYKEGR